MHHQHTEDETSGYISDHHHTARSTVPSSPDMWHHRQQQQLLLPRRPGGRPPLRLPHDEHFERSRGAAEHLQRRGRSPPRSTVTDATDLERETEFSVAKCVQLTS